MRLHFLRASTSNEHWKLLVTFAAGMATVLLVWFAVTRGGQPEDGSGAVVESTKPEADIRSTEGGDPIDGSRAHADRAHPPASATTEMPPAGSPVAAAPSPGVANTSTVPPGELSRHPAAPDPISTEITAVDCSQRKVGPVGLSRDAAGKFCLVHIVETNTSATASDLRFRECVIAVTGGGQYPEDGSASSRANADITNTIGELAPGQSLKRSLAFDVPLDQDFEELRCRQSGSLGFSVIS